MTLNTADRKSVRAAEKAADRADRARGEIITSIMSTTPGRAFFWDKLSAAGIFTTTFSSDPIQMAFNEGQRNQGLLLLNDIIQWCPEQFILAMREFNGRRTSDAAGSDAGQRSDREDGNGRDQGSAVDADGDDTGFEGGVDRHEASYN